MPGWPPGNYLDLPDDFPMPKEDGRDARGNPTATRDTDWGMLCRGKTLGKRVNIDFVFAGIAAQTNFINILEVKGEDEFALPLSLQISPPRIFRNGPPPAANLQNASGTEDNVELLGSSISFANPFVRVEWGIGGISNLVECDCLNGLFLNLSASWVRVSGAIVSPDLPADSTAYELSAFIGPGNPKPNNAQRTIVVPIVNGAIGAESDKLPIPRYAKTIYLAGTNSVFDTFVGVVNLYRDSGPAFAEVGYIFNANQPTPFPIPLGCYYFTTVNGIINPQHNVVFELAV